MSKYRVLIGLEMHCEISETNSKVFSSAPNGYSDVANCFISPVDMAFPGVLPVVNKEAVRKSLMASMILGCTLPSHIYFERKNYYYPDLPKGFQITQETKPAPIGIYGSLTYDCLDYKKTVRVNNIHLEEDAAASEHLARESLINYNRAGVPLLELVTEPDFRNANEAVSFLETMRSVYQYAGISEADSKKGQVRCDVNISLMDVNLDESDMSNWGTKVEIKNVNSFGGVRDAINYEIERQTSALENGTYSSEVIQETRRWDEESFSTISMRSKADAIDYKYFVEPNIPKYKLTSSWIDSIRASIPELGFERKEKYVSKLGLSNYDATILVKEKEVSDYFESCLKEGTDAKMASNWITSIILGYLNKSNLSISSLFVTPKMLCELIDKVSTKVISSKQGKEVLYKAIETEVSPLSIIEKEGLTQIGDSSEILSFVIEVLNENEDMIAKYKAGRTNVIDFFVGQVMKKTRGKANPGITMDLFKSEIDKR